MKKVLIMSCILSLTIASSAFAADTYVGSLLEKQQQKLDNAASPLINKEREARQKQQAITNMKPQNPAAQQQALIEKKKQQVQAQKDALKKQQEGLKNLFTTF